MAKLKLNVDTIEDNFYRKSFAWNYVSAKKLPFLLAYKFNIKLRFQTEHKEIEIQLKKKGRNYF